MEFCGLTKKHIEELDHKKSCITTENNLSDHRKHKDEPKNNPKEFL